MIGYRTIGAFALVCVCATVLCAFSKLTGTEYASLVGSVFGAYCVRSIGNAVASRPAAPVAPVPSAVPPQTVINVAPEATP